MIGWKAIPKRSCSLWGGQLAAIESTLQRPRSRPNSIMPYRTFVIIRGGNVGGPGGGGSINQYVQFHGTSCSHGDDDSSWQPQYFQCRGLASSSSSSNPKRRDGDGGGGRNKNKKSPSANNKKRNGRRRYQLQQQQQQNEPDPSTIRRPHRSKIQKAPQASKERIVPPALLAPTGSPFVYISKPALVQNQSSPMYEDDDDDDDDELEEVEDEVSKKVHLSVANLEDDRSEEESDEDDNEGDYNEDKDVDEDDDVDEDVDASALFAEAFAGTIPPTFSSSTFHYLSPRDLGHELPLHNLPEVAFLGRSNVGKSSLINALMRQKLCLTSKSPGRTRQAYYYGLYPNSTLQHQTSKTNNNKKNSTATLSSADATGFVVDLPGYGYANAPDDVVGDWQSTTQEILLNRRDAGVLQRLYLLIDCRREGPQPADRTVMSWLDQAEIPYTMVLTKADRVAVPMVIKQVNDLCIRFASQQSLEGIVFQSPVIHVTSSNEGMGIRELMFSIETEFVGL